MDGFHIYKNINNFAKFSLVVLVVGLVIVGATGGGALSSDSSSHAAIDTPTTDGDDLLTATPTVSILHTSTDETATPSSTPSSTPTRTPTPTPSVITSTDQILATPTDTPSFSEEATDTNTGDLESAGTSDTIDDIESTADGVIDTENSTETLVTASPEDVTSDTTGMVGDTSDDLGDTVDETQTTLPNTTGATVDTTVSTIEETTVELSGTTEQTLVATGLTVVDRDGTVTSTMTGTPTGAEPGGSTVTFTDGLTSPSRSSGTVVETTSGHPPGNLHGGDSRDDAEFRPHPGSPDRITSGAQVHLPRGDPPGTTPGSLPATGIAFGVGAVAIGGVCRTLLTNGGLVNAATTWGRVIDPLGRLTRWASLFRYSRWCDSDPLEHDGRDRLYQSVTESPGQYMTEVSKDLGMPLSTLRHHVKILEREDLISTAKIEGRVRLFTAVGENKELKAALQDDAKRPIVSTLARRGPTNGNELASELEKDVSTITYHLKRLEENDIVERSRDGRSVVNNLTPAARDALMTTQTVETTDPPVPDATAD